jgi:hypothetical protein
MPGVLGSDGSHTPLTVFFELPSHVQRMLGLCLFGTLTVRVHHITNSVFDIGPNFIQVISHTIGNKPSIPLKSAGSQQKMLFVKF